MQCLLFICWWARRETQPAPMLTLWCDQYCLFSDTQRFVDDIVESLGESRSPSPEAEERREAEAAEREEEEGARRPMVRGYRSP